MAPARLCGSPRRPTATGVAGHMSMLTKFNPGLQAALSGVGVSAWPAETVIPAVGTRTRQAEGMA
jgi:hypothetical protein